MRFFAASVLVAALLVGTGYSFADQGTNVDSVTFVQHTDEGTALEAMQDGSFDIYYYPVPHDSAAEPDGIRVFDSVGGIKYDLFVNPADVEGQFNPFAHQEIRYSLNFLADRQAIVRDLFQGYGHAVVSSFGPTHPDYILVYRQLDAIGIRYDPQLADKMISDVLAAQGATKTDGAWLMGGDPITVKMFIRSDDPVRDAIGRSVASELEGLGLAVEITTGNLEDAFGAVFGSDPAGLGWHIYTGAFGGASVTKYDNSSLAEFYAPWASFMPGRNNPEYWNYENMLLDEITMRLSSEGYENAEQRANLVRQATMEGVQESVRVFLGIENDRYIARDGISGVVNVQGDGITNRATPINAGSADGSLTIGVKYIAQSSWNPVLGLSDGYSNNIFDVLHDPVFTRDPFTGDLTPVRSAWDVSTAGPDGDMDIPGDAVAWNPATQQWDRVLPDAKATSVVTLDFDFSDWHNGVPMDINDVLYPLYLSAEWGSNDSTNPDDISRYNEEIDAGNTGTIKAVRVTGPASVDVYTDYWHFDDAEIAAHAAVWSSTPWEVYAAMEKVVLDGDAAFSNSNAVENNIPWLSLLDGDDSELVKGALEGFVSDGTVPAGLYAVPADPAARYGASIGWITDKGNAVISNGPFYLDTYSPDTQTLEAKAFDDPSYPLGPGHWSYLAEDRDALEGQVTIGSLAPITGGASGYGAEISEASDLAIEHFNDYLERRDAPWSLATDRRDTATDPAAAILGLTALNEAGIKIVDGPAIDYSGDVLEFANSNDMLLVSCCSVTTPLAQEDDALFRMAPGHSHHAEKLAGLMHGDGITTVVPVGRDSAWINDLLGLAGSSFAGLSEANTVVPRTSYGTDLDGAAADLAAAVQGQLDRTDAGKVAVLYVGFEENVEFIKSASSHDVLDDVRWYGAELNTVAPNVTDDSVAGPFAERVGLTAVQPTVHDNQITQQIREHFASSGQFDRPPSVYTSFEYDAVWLLGLSLLGAQSTDVSAVKSALADASRQYVGASGHTGLDAAGDRADGQYATWKVVDGEWIEIVDIGGLVPVSRADGAGVHRQVATEIAVSDFNDYLEENDAGWRLGIDIRDTASAGYDGPIRSLGDGGVSLVSGPSASSGVSSIKDYVDANNMLLLSCCSTAPSLAIEGDNVFRLAPDDSLHGPVIAELLAEDGKEVLISVWRDDPFGNGLHESTVARFTELGGTADDLGSYQLCDGEGCYGDTFEAMAQQLSEKVQGYVDTHGSDKIGILYVGTGEAEEFIENAADHPVLRTVQWIGSDANVLSESLIHNTKVFEFLRDANFRSCIFDSDTTGEAYQHLERRLSADPRIMGTPNVYTYASYDTVWILGLAMEAAGDAGFEEVKRQVPLVTAAYSGALGDIELNAAGDASEASYAVWGIEPGGWERIGTYVPGTGLIRAETVVGALLNLAGPFSGENIRYRAMQIAADDFNGQNPQAPLRLVMEDISAQKPHTAMQNIRHDIDDAGNRDALRGLVDASITSYDSSVSSDPAGGAAAYFDSVSGTGQGQPPGLFVIDGTTGVLVAHGDSSTVGTSIDAFEPTYDKGLAGINAGIAGDPNGETWWQHMSEDGPAEGPQLKRSLLVGHDGYVFGAGYYPKMNGNSYFVGTSSSANLASLKAYTDVYATDTVMVSPSSTAPSLAVTDNIFRLAPADSHQVPAIISKLNSDGKTQLIVANRDGPWGNGILEAIRAGYDGQIRAAIPYDTGSPDYASIAAGLGAALSATLPSHDASTVAVVFIGFDVEFIGLAKEIDGGAAAGALDVKWYGADGVATSKNIVDDPVAGPIAARVGLTATIFEVADNPVNERLSAQMQAEGLNVARYSFEAYDAVHLIGNSVLEADMRDLPVVDVLPEVAERSSGALGDYSLDEAGDLDRPLAYAAYKVVGTPGSAPQWANEDGFGGIAGRLFADANGNGVFDRGADSGIAGATVIAVDLANTQVINTATAADGTYGFDNAGLGEFLVQVAPFPEGHVPSIGSSYYARVALAQGSTATADFALEPISEANGVTVSGTVFTDGNGNGTQDAGEAGVPGYTMYAVDLLTQKTSSTTTGADGAYAFGGIMPDPGATLVQTAFFPFDHTVSTGSFYTYVVEPERGSDITFNVGFRPVQPSEYVTLEITAYVDADSDGVRDAGEPGFPGIGVTTYTYTTTELEEVTTGADGTATKPDLTPADWVAQVATVPDGYRVTSPTDSITQIPGVLTAVGPAPGSTYTMSIGLSDRPAPLTGEEASWLVDNPTIRVAYDPSWQPVEYVNDDGELDGLAGQYVARFEEFTGADFETADIRNWADALAAVRDGRADILTMVVDTEGRHEFLEFTTPHTYIQADMVTRQDSTVSVSQLAGLRVATVEGYAIESWLVENHPDVEYTSFENAAGALAAVAGGSMDVYIDSWAVSSHIADANGIGGLTTSGPVGYEYVMSVGVHRDNPILKSIMQKALDSIPDETKQQMLADVIGPAAAQ